LGPRPSAPGRCVYPTSATDHHHEHPARSLGSRITALSSFRRRARLPRRLPGRNLGRQHDRVEPRLTSRLKLQRGRLNVPSVSRGAKPCPVLRSSSRSSPSSAPSSRRCRPGEKVVVLPLTPSFKLLPAGRWDLTPSFPRARAPRTASARRAVKRDVLHRSRAPSCNPAIHEHSPRSPETLCAPTIRHLAVALSFWAFALSDHRRVRSGWRGAPCGVTPAELHRNRTRSARAAQVPPIT